MMGAMRDSDTALRAVIAEEANVKQVDLVDDPAAFGAEVEG